jgi:hypothetical protein
VNVGFVAEIELVPVDDRAAAQLEAPRLEVLEGEIVVGDGTIAPVCRSAGHHEERPVYRKARAPPERRRAPKSDRQVDLLATLPDRRREEAEGDEADQDVSDDCDHARTIPTL